MKDILIQGYPIRFSFLYEMVYLMNLYRSILRGRS